MICSHGGFDLVVDRLVSCCGLLLTWSVRPLIVVHLDEGNFTFTMELSIFERLYIPDTVTGI